MPKDYYLILGIPATSSQVEIKAAFRRLAKEYHPDYFGGGQTPFQNIQEAYSVLGDPVSRKVYDEQSESPKIKCRRGSKDVYVEPLSPTRHPNGGREAQLIRPFQAYRTSFDTLFDHLFSNFIERSQSASERSGSLDVVVTLTPAEALKGGHVRVQLPVSLQCPGCKGYGSIGFYKCWRCSGTGTLSGEYPIIINYPPGISNNQMLRLSLERFGMQNCSLLVSFRITDDIR